MAYIGRALVQGNYVKLDDLQSQFNGSTSTFSLKSGGAAYTPGSANTLLVSLGGVIQEPIEAFTVTNDQITFTNAPTAGTDVFIVALGAAVSIGTPADGSVTGAKLSTPFNYVGVISATSFNSVGVNTAQAGFEVGALASIGATISASGNATFAGIVTTSRLNVGTSGTVITTTSSGLVGVGTTNPRFKLEVGAVGASGTSLHVNGDARVTGILTVGSSSVIINGANDQINVGTAVTISSSGLTITGVITATSFSGSGANLTGLAATANVTTSSLVVIGVSTVAAGSTAAPSISPTGDSNTGIFFPSADTIAFGEGGAEAARIDSSGRLLVGTSSPLTGSDTQYSKIQIQNNTFGSDTPAYFALSRSGSLTSTDLPVGRIWFGGSGTDLRADISAFTDGASSGSSDTPGRLVFSTTLDGQSSPTARAQITNKGRFDIFGDSTTDSCIVTNAAGAGTAIHFFSGRHSSTGFATGTESFRVATNGNVVNTNGSYTAISDAKLKENIVDAGSQWDDLKAIQIRNWNFKAETGHETHRQIGPIAQELETVCPGLVFETPDRDEDGNETGEVTKGVNQSVLYMKAVKALQEAMERIEQLEAKVAALEAQ